MKWNELFPKQTEPTLTQVSEFIDSKYYLMLVELLTEQMQGKPTIQYIGCSLPGWNIKFKKSGKSLLTIYPQNGYFKVLIIASQKMAERNQQALQRCNKDFKVTYEENDYFNGAKWIFFDIKEETHLRDLREFLYIRYEVITGKQLTLATE
ncbi:hypothetical protein M2139_001655 [Enterococcus sp. PF1-24]|uniref:DUF3788 family protein n=1 Tax=unclassified Enterococcus TaxID=2608891 RepID=UPI0024756262|nr:MULTISPECIES: DUF3788 family protein [unclassified Enterococcus]MDH6364668.1 hypothetical protein [Enterococcus sp. PFB1-1]MDH6401769.1 hypothetical protein [Enterococcus sp. PF1-24]